jgi:Flp pilus assembly protein TadG
MFRFGGGLSGRKHVENGQTMVEFSMVFIVFIFIAFSIIETSRIAITYVAVSSSSREAARYGAAVGNDGNGTSNKYEDCVGIREAAKRVASTFLEIDDSNITIQYDKGPSSEVYASCPPQAKPIQLGDRIIVTVHANYAPLLPIGLGNIDIVSEARRTILKNIVVE